MVITKTKFINYTKCPYYYHYDKVSDDNFNKKITIKEYFEEQNRNKYEIDNRQLEIMLPYYKKCEELATKIAGKYFDGLFINAESTKDQEAFECRINGNLYACYVDIYNETEDGDINIFEVKSTTSDKFIKTNFFYKKDNILYLKEINDKVKNKLLNRYDSCGKYIYDLAVQRYIIEKDLKKNGLNYINTNYYLAILNSEYTYDGISDYDIDKNGNEIVLFIDVNELTRLYIPIINLERKKLEKIINSEMTNIQVGPYCGYGKVTKCTYCNTCFKKLPDKNSVLGYLDSHYGFNYNEKRVSVYDLINKGYYSISDVPNKFLINKKNIIQKEVIESQTPYINYQKIKDGLDLIKYPIYHLDFETFPCPIPRFKGEKCYTQSVFQFSLHIQTKKYCDKEKSHYGFLASTNNDERENLIKELCSLIKNQGTVLVYNSSFEKNRLKELSIVFPKYKKELDFINNMVFDLLDIVKTNKKLYMNLGYSEEESSMFNYYHSDLNGSFSIKKVLPLFSDLNYQSLDVSNGVEAYETYLKFKSLQGEELEQAYLSLIEYCKQDTWAMVEIFNKLKDLSKNVK